LKTSDFYYDLPPELIAQHPASRRDGSRLLIYDRAKKSIKDGFFPEVLDYLNEGDCLVVNRTRVIPARLIGSRIAENGEKGGAMEFLLLKRLDETRWETLVKPGRRAKTGARFSFGDGELTAVVEDSTPDGGRIVRFAFEGIWEEVLDRVGKIPLPPYITEELKDPERYQTVYSKEEGSAAAPTAGLHFTPELLQKSREKGVKIVEVLLHVGLGTFRPVKAEDVSEHHMHAEYYEVSDENAQVINACRASGGRVICVGTTSCRTLETVADDAGIIHPGRGWTDIFITPGYRFKAVDALITNFHLPESTLLMLISALCGREEILAVYEHAVRERYRFFSFGDAMLIL
jgi:S-adenosylmethionine:tRNA ribosyltransferase-isomerase